MNDENVFIIIKYINIDKNYSNRPELFCYATCIRHYYSIICNLVNAKANNQQSVR